MRAEADGENRGGRARASRRLGWLFVALALAWLGSFALFPQAFFHLGVNHFGVWFLDTHALLASNDALALGLDPYLPNRLDYFNRPHVYSHWWLHLRDVGLTRAHVFPVGLTLVTAFVAMALGQMRPRTPGELFWYAAVFFSSPVLLAIDRANNDLVVFLLLSTVVPALLSPHRAVRFLAVVPVAMAAGLKFYPAIAGLVLAAGPEKREVRARLGLAFMLLGGVGLNVFPDLTRYGGLVPKAEGLMTFGGANLLAALGLAGRPATAVSLGLAGLTGCVFLRSRLFDGWTIRPEDERSWLGFVLGAALLAGCFFLGTNFAYRWIFALWLAPFLWALLRDPAAPIGARRLAKATSVLLIFVLWSDAAASSILVAFTGRTSADVLVRWADRFFLVEQPVVWAFFCCLVGFLAHFVRGACRALFVRH